MTTTASEVTPASMGAAYGVHSEVGKLRKVMVHRPDLELKRLTPGNHDDLLFDDVLWVRRARQQHDTFADLLRDRGVDVVYLEELLAETLAVPEGRAWVLGAFRVSDTAVAGGNGASVPVDTPRWRQWTARATRP